MVQTRQEAETVVALGKAVRRPVPSAAGRISQPQAKAKLEARSETAIKREVVRALNLLPGVFAFPTNVGKMTAEHQGKVRLLQWGFLGLSDVIGWRRRIERIPAGRVWQLPGVPIPRWLALEVKKPSQVPDVLAGFVVAPQRRYLKTTGKARVRAEQQRAFLQMVRQAGGIAAVVTSAVEAVAVLGS